MSEQWWKEAIVYQIYPKSFYDGNDDGHGDLQGIVSKLDYLKNLGVDVIWVCPIFQSPNKDNGYDISDYKAIMGEFGTMKDFDELLMEVHQRGMKLILDLVSNHCSSDHAWFQKSVQDIAPYKDYFFWKNPKNGLPPNNWQSFFGGSCWTYHEMKGQYYFHLFLQEQPDLNWENPRVREEIFDIMKFWLDKGIDGFRLDVIGMISKDLSFPDTGLSNFQEIIHTVYANGPRVHAYLQEMHEKVLSHYDIMTVGEGTGISADHANLYVGKDRHELNMIFHFDHLFLGTGDGGKYDPIPWTLPEFKKIYQKWDQALGIDGWGCSFLGNHDFGRIVSRFGNDKTHRVASAKLLATLILTMKGTVFIYQGEEIGMTNVQFSDIHEYNDVETINFYHKAIKAGKSKDEVMDIVHDCSRDNARTPMQWSAGKFAGFSSVTPWIKINSNYQEINVAANEKNPDSVLHYYRKLIQLRKQHDSLVYGEFKLLAEDHTALFIYERKMDRDYWLIALNFSDNPQNLDLKSWTGHKISLVMSNYVHDELVRGEEILLSPWEANIFKLSNHD